jgi:hypothetical protein
LRITSAYSRARALQFIAAFVALSLIPAAAQAAPKKVRLRFSATAISVNESNTAVNVTVLRAGNTRVAATVNYDVVAGSTTAVAGVNYTFAPGTLSFAAGETRKTFPVTIINNSTYDPPNKKIVFHLSGATPAGSMIQGGNATLTILDDDGPGTIDLGAPNYSVVESAGVATVTVTRNTTANIVESVDYTTTELAAGTGHATAGTDYTTSSGTITFGAGENSKSFQVPVLDDSLFEGDETLGLTLSNPQNLTNPLLQPTLGPNNATPATLTIVDDDVSTFSFSSSTYSVGEEDGTATITVNRGGATNVAADVDYSLDGAAPGSATGGGVDYTLTAGTLHFAAGETTQTFPVTIAHDTLAEGNETVGLQLTQNGTQVGTALLSIVDDDNPLPSVQFDNVGYSVNEAATDAIVTVTLSKQYVNDVTVQYATADSGTSPASGVASLSGAPSDGSADYQTTTGTLTFLAGQTSKTIDIPLNPDTVNEDDETFAVTLSGNTNSALGAPHQATVTIVDDDSAGTLEFSSQRYDVNETGGHATITVNRVGGSSGAVSADYATTDGTANAPSDYTAMSGTLNFADGETQKTFDIPVAWDGRGEGDETVSLALSNFNSDDDPTATKVAVLHIADDGASGPVQFSAGSYDVSEAGGSATITVNRSGGSLGGPVTVDYATSDGTAHAGSDYTATQGTLTFGAGDTAKTFQVPVTDDNVRQGGRSLNLTLSNPGGGTAVGSQGTSVLNIGDNEPVSSASKDATAPKLKVTAKKLQKALKAKRFVLKVRSNEAAKLAVTLKVRKGAKSKKLVTAAKASKKVGAGKTVTIKVKLSKKAIAKLSKVLANGKVKITLIVTGTDAAGNKATIRRTITIR